MGTKFRAESIGRALLRGEDVCTKDRVWVAKLIDQATKYVTANGQLQVAGGDDTQLAESVNLHLGRMTDLLLEEVPE